MLRKYNDDEYGEKIGSRDIQTEHLGHERYATRRDCSDNPG